MEISNGYCNNCKADVKIVSKPVNHLLHFIISLLTGGSWIIVWLFFAFVLKKWNCNICGAKI